MFKDFKELLSVLNAHSVRYLVIGGQAVNVHAQPRATKDLDLWVSPDPANATALFEALTEFGAPMEDITPETLLKKGEFFRMGVPPVMVDILCDMKGVDFDAAWQRKLDVVVDKRTKLIAGFIGREDLITAKKMAGRPQDIADVAALEKGKKATQTTSRRKPRSR
jgi:hypothetical protein